MKQMLLSLLFAVLNVMPVSATVMDSINAEFSPLSPRWGVAEIGWLYRPQFSYTLTGVLTRLGKFETAGSDLPTVTLEVYQGLPISNGILLRSATFSVVDHSFAGGSFSPLALCAGEDYFIGFRNVQTLLLNVTEREGVSLITYSDWVNDGTYSTLATEYSIPTYPILKFEGVPEPATVLLLGLGGALAFRRKR